MKLLTLQLSMSIAIEVSKEVICIGLKVIAEVEEVIFPISLIDTTIQDGSLRERMDNKGVLLKNTEI